MIAKNSNSDLPVVLEQRKKTDRKFEFTKFKQRHVLLKICYFGWDYLGFAVQVLFFLSVQDNSVAFFAIPIPKFLSSNKILYQDVKKCYSFFLQFRKGKLYDCFVKMSENFIY